MALHITATEPDPENHPEKKLMCESILHQGSRVTKRSRLWEIRSPKTGQHKKYGLTLENEYPEGSPKRISLEDGSNENSIKALYEFLVGSLQIHTKGNYVVVSVADGQVYQTLTTISENPENHEFLAQMSKWIAGNEKIKTELAKLASDSRVQSFAATINHKRMSQALDEFREMIEQKLDEPKYQKFLEKHNWIFGSEYSAMLERDLIWKGQLDFPMRRTADGYLEVIEIKTPHVDLFSCNGKRYIEKSEVWYAINQVDDYLARVRNNFTELQAKYPDLGLRNLRGKVIIGKSKDNEREALRRLNARLNRIEVITYDQLIAIAQRMLDILKHQQTADDNENDPAPPPSSVDDIPL